MKSGPRINDKLFYGWVVAIASFFIILIVLGTRLSFGVFFKPLASDFGLNRAETSGVYSAHMLLSCLFAIVSGWGIDKFGPRVLVGLMGFFIGLSVILTSQAHSVWQLFVVYGFLFAVGAGGVFGVLMSILVRWFNQSIPIFCARSRQIVFFVFTDGSSYIPFLGIYYLPFLLSR